MAAVSGHLMPIGEVLIILASMGPVSANDPHYDAVNPYYATLSIIGGDAIRGVIESDGQAVAGNIVPSYVDDFYFRFHLTPWRIDFGYILTTTEEFFVLWNAYFVPKVCTVINFINEDEFTLSGLTPSFTLNGLEQTTYSVIPTEDGNPAFEASISFDFGVNDTYVVMILTGTRIILFKWSPRQPIIEHLEWLTNIIGAKDGSEQRISVRRIPRQVFRFSVYFSSEKEQSEYEAMSHKWQKRAWGLPVWFELVPHSTDINVSDSAITVDTTNADFRDGGIAVIWKSLDEFEIVRIDTVSANSLSLSTFVQNAFTGNKFIIPCRIARMSSAVRGKESPGGYSTVEFSFVVEDNILLTGYSAATTYKTLPVLTDAPIVGKTQTKISDGDISITDFDTGKFLVYSDSEFNKVIQSHTFKNYVKADTWNYRLFLHYLLGQLNTVWVPTFKRDMLLTENIGSSDTSFRIENIGLANNMGVNDLRTHLAFIFPDGSMLLREIVNIVEIDANEESIYIDSSLSQAISIDECKIGFLDRCRLASDMIKINWEHLGWSTSKINWLKVKE